MAGLDAEGATLFKEKPRKLGREMSASSCLHPKLMEDGMLNIYPLPDADLVSHSWMPPTFLQSKGYSVWISEGHMQLLSQSHSSLSSWHGAAPWTITCTFRFQSIPLYSCYLYHRKWGQGVQHPHKGFYWEPCICFLLHWFISTTSSFLWAVMFPHGPIILNEYMQL